MKDNSKYTNDDLSAKAGGKGFYIALAVCLVAVCGVAVATFVGGLTDDKPKTGVSGTKATTTTTEAREVVIPATDVKDDRTTITTTTTMTIPRPTISTTTTTTEADMFVFPASNRVLLAFSDALIYSETLGEWGTHNGVDFAVEKGAQVKAVANGTVKRIYQDALWGSVIEIDHGGKVISRSCGVNAANLQEGQSVTAGDVIGTAGEIPAEILMDTHMHLEILANDKYVDPLLLIRGEAVMVE